MSSSTSATPTKTPSKTAMEIQRESSINRLLNERNQAISSSDVFVARKGDDATQVTNDSGGNTLISSPDPRGYSNNFLLHYVVDNNSPEAVTDAPPSPPPPPRKIKGKRNVNGATSANVPAEMNVMVTPTKRSTNSSAADEDQISRPARKIKLIHNKIDNTGLTMLPPESDNITTRNTIYRGGIRNASAAKKVSFPTLTLEADQTRNNDQSPDLNNDEEEQVDHPDERKGISGRELVASGMGTSTEPALIAPIRDKKTGERHKVLSAPWRCGERHCNTGQTWYPRQAVGRKCVSQYFGRNKKETNSIPGEVWNFHCRKHYQRESYSRQFLDTTQKIVAEVNGLRSQVDRLKLWRPEARFKIQLTKAVHDRLQVFQTAYRRCEGSESDAKHAGEEAWKKKFNIVDERKMQPADKFHPILAEEFGTANLEQEEGYYEDIDRVLEWILEQAQSSRLTVIPPFELLILPKEDDEIENDISDNYERYMYDVVDKNEDFATAQEEVETARAVQGPHRQHSRIRDTRPRPLVSRISREVATDRPSFAKHTITKEEEMLEEAESGLASQAGASVERMDDVVYGSNQSQLMPIAKMRSANLPTSNHTLASKGTRSPFAKDLPNTTFGATNTEPLSFNKTSAKKVRPLKILKTPTRTSPRRKIHSADSSMN